MSDCASECLSRRRPQGIVLARCIWRRGNTLAIAAAMCTERTSQNTPWTEWRMALEKARKYAASRMWLRTTHSVLSRVGRSMVASGMFRDAALHLGATCSLVGRFQRALADSIGKSASDCVDVSSQLPHILAAFDVWTLGAPASNHGPHLVHPSIGRTPVWYREGLLCHHTV